MDVENGSYEAQDWNIVCLTNLRDCRRALTNKSIVIRDLEWASLMYLPIERQISEFMLHTKPPCRCSLRGCSSAELWNFLVWFKHW